MSKRTMVLAIVVWLGCYSSFAEEADQGEQVQRYVSMLKDPKSDIRRKAISGLRKLASRIHRSGEIRIVRPPNFSPEEAERLMRRQMAEGYARSTKAKAERDALVGRRLPLEGGPDFAPKVEGLVPYLIRAAGDKEESNRVLALYALADTRDPLGQVELRNRLQDPSERVRFAAACLLTEFLDTSGLSELKEALQRYETDTEDKQQAPLYYAHASRLLYSFQRITGKSMGDIPLGPHLESDQRKWPEIRKRYASLLHNWAVWWEWQPSVESE